MRRTIATGIVTVLAMLAPSAGAWAQSVTAAGALTERYEPAARISGTPLVGVVPLAGAASAVVAGGTGTLSGFIPKDWGGGVACARLVSIDGRYEAHQQYAVPADWPGGMAALAFPTRYREILDGLAPDRLAVLIRAAPCDAEGPAAPDVAVAAGGWNAPDAPAGVQLLINSFRADETYLILADGTEVDCVPLAAAQRTAFDVTCTIAAAAFGSEGQLDIELDRVREGAISPPISFTIAFSP
jgi:hypothetical protein